MTETTEITKFPTRPTWNDELQLLVPKIEFQDNHYLCHGSAVVASKTPSGAVIAYFEGNIFHAANIKTFEDKALLAYGRLVQNYPTTGKMGIDPNEYEICGTIRSGKCKIVETPAFKSWTSEQVVETPVY